MQIPKPDEFAKQHGHNPFPPRWEKWLSSVRQAILTSQPAAGRHVSVDEHPGKGTVINIDDTSARRPGGGGGGPILGACCHVDGTCSIETEADCDGAYQGDGTTCEDIDCTHTGACCIGSDCSITREDDCPGTYQGDGTTCDPNPCAGVTPSCDCGFPEFIETDPTLRYAVKTYTFTRSASSSVGHPTCDISENYTTTKTITLFEDGTCEMNTECSGSVSMHEEGEDVCNESWVNSGTHEHDDDAGFAGGCHQSGSGCHSCAAGNCDTALLTPSSPTTAEGTCSVDPVTGVHADLTYTAVLSEPFFCA